MPDTPRPLTRQECEEAELRAGDWRVESGYIRNDVESLADSYRAAMEALRGLQTVMVDRAIVEGDLAWTTDVVKAMQTAGDLLRAYDGSGERGE